MSVPFSRISCSGCDLQTTSLIVNGSFSYRGSGGPEANLDRELGVCGSCESVVVKERLPDRGEFEAARPVFALGSIRKWLLRRRLDKTSLRRSLTEKALDRSFPFEVIAEVMDLRRSEVCLSCGSEDVLALPRPDGFTTRDDRLQETGMRHPGCGGMLMIRGSGGFRVASALRRHTYDIHGRRLSTEP